MRVFVRFVALLAMSAFWAGNANADLFLTVSGLDADQNGAADSGTFSFLSASPPTLPGPTTSSDGLQSATYSYSVTGLTVDGVSGVDLTFDMTVDSGSGNSLVKQSEFWMIDADADGGDPDAFRVTSGETMTFSVSNVVATGGVTASFLQVNGIGFENHGGVGGVSIDAPAGTITTDIPLSGGDGIRVNDVVLLFTLSAIPEPSSLVLLGLTGLGLVVRRRR